METGKNDLSPKDTAEAYWTLLRSGARELRQILTHSLLSASPLLHDEALPATETVGEEISDRLNWIKEAHARFGGAPRMGCSCATGEGA